MTIPFNTGIPSLLKEKGFDEPCYAFKAINPHSKFHLKEYRRLATVTNSGGLSGITMPTYDQVCDWLEEKHGIVIYNVPIEVYPDVLRWEPAIFGHDSIMFTMYNTRYEALNEGIKEGLKLINK